MKKTISVSPPKFAYMSQSILSSGWKKKADLSGVVDISLQLWAIGPWGILSHRMFTPSPDSDSLADSAHSDPACRFSHCLLGLPAICNPQSCLQRSAVGGESYSWDHCLLQSSLTLLHSELLTSDSFGTVRDVNASRMQSVSIQWPSWAAQHSEQSKPQASCP